jgi:hypothetical protein
MSGSHSPRPQPVGGSPVLVWGQNGMSSSDFAATTGAAAGPHSVLGHSGPGHGWQFGDVGEIHPLFLQLTAAAGAEVQGYRYFYGQLSDLFRAGRLSEGEGALPGLRPGRLGWRIQVPLEKGTACPFSLG